MLDALPRQVMENNVQNFTVAKNTFNTNRLQILRGLAFKHLSSVHKMQNKRNKLSIKLCAVYHIGVLL